MNELDTRTVEGKRGLREASEVPDSPPGARRACSFDLLAPGRAAALTTSKQRCVFCFLVSLLGAAVPGMTTRGWAVPTVLTGATGAQKGDGVILGVPLPSTQHASFIINLRFHNVRCSEAGKTLRPSPHSFSCCAPCTHPEQGPC